MNLIQSADGDNIAEILPTEEGNHEAGRLQMKTIETKVNSKGTKYALTTDDDTFGVWILSSNYKLGKCLATWKYVKLGMTLEDATKMFERLSK
jgi:hypothetical protein